jgi:DNA-binding CsgD family transcriptional regulator
MPLRAHQLVKQATVAAFAVDERDRIVAWNENAHQAFGFPPKAVLGRSSGDALEIRDAFGNRACPRNCAFHLMAKHREAIDEYTLQVKSAGGDYVMVYGSAEVVRSERMPSYEIVFFLRPERRRQTIDAMLERPIHRRTFDEMRAQMESGLRAADLKLTGRQRQVLVLLAAGRTTGEIAKALGVSLNTVRHHMQNILDKLDCHSQAQAVAVAIRQNLI